MHHCLIIYLLFKREGGLLSLIFCKIAKQYFLGYLMKTRNFTENTFFTHLNLCLLLFWNEEILKLCDKTFSQETQHMQYLFTSPKRKVCLCLTLRNLCIFLLGPQRVTSVLSLSMFGRSFMWNILSFTTLVCILRLPWKAHLLCVCVGGIFLSCKSISKSSHMFRHFVVLSRNLQMDSEEQTIRCGRCRTDLMLLSLGSVKAAFSFPAESSTSEKLPFPLSSERKTYFQFKPGEDLREGICIDRKHILLKMCGISPSFRNGNASEKRLGGIFCMVH